MNLRVPRLFSKWANFKEEIFIKDKLENINLKELEQLSLSHELLSYSQLCNRLNVGTYHGNQKKSQLQQLQSYCDFHMMASPTRYIIDQYYYGAVQVINSNRGKYTPYIEAIVCSKLQKEETIYVTTRDIIQMTNMANKNYFKVFSFKARNYICQLYGYDISTFDQFVDEIYDSVFRPIVRDALASMEGRRIINLNTAYAYYTKDHYRRFCPSDSDLGRKFLEIEYEARRLMDIPNNSKFLSKSQWRNFFDLCDGLAAQQFVTEGITNFYKCKQIVSKKSIAIKAFEEVCKMLNGNVRDRILNLPSLDKIDIYDKIVYTDDLVSLHPPKEYIIPQERKE